MSNKNSAEYRRALQDLIKYEIQALVSRLAEVGEEAVIITACLGENTCTKLGSKKGEDFLHQAPYLVRQFLNFCAGQLVPNIQQGDKSPQEAGTAVHRSTPSTDQTSLVQDWKVEVVDEVVDTIVGEQDHTDGDSGEDDSRRMYKCSTCHMVIVGRKSFRLHMENHKQEVLSKCFQFGKEGFKKGSMTNSREEVDVLNTVSEIPADVLTNVSVEAPEDIQGDTTVGVFASDDIHGSISPNSKENGRFSTAYSDTDTEPVYASTSQDFQKNENLSSSTGDLLGPETLYGPRSQDHFGNDNSASNRLASDPVQCQVCSKILAGIHSFRRHMLIHRGEKPHKCRFCSKYFRDKSACKRHERRHASGKGYSCRFCGKSYPDKQDLLNHTFIHAGESKMPGTRRKNDISYVHSDNVPPRKVVPKGFSKSHMYQFYGRKLRKNYGNKLHKCEFCGKIVNSRGSYVRHRRIHTGEKPFVCSICDKAFSDSSARVRHVRSHTQKKPYQSPCNICGLTFTDEFTYQVHIQTHVKGEADDTVTQNSNSANYENNPEPLFSIPNIEQTNYEEHTNGNKQNVVNSDKNTCVEQKNVTIESYEQKGDISFETNQSRNESTESTTGLGNETSVLKIKEEPESDIYFGETYKTNSVQVFFDSSKSHAVEPYPTSGFDRGSFPDSQETPDINVNVNNSDSTVCSRQNFPCTNCSRLFISEREVTLHLQECQEFSNQNSLADVSSQVVSKKELVPIVYLFEDIPSSAVKCNLCMKFFPKLSELDIHMDSIHGGYVCEFCGKKVCNSFSYKRHRRIHLGEKPFSCAFCNKAFSDKSACKRHSCICKKRS